MARRSLAGWPMFSRVLAVMLAGVVAVQFANFGLLQFVRLPRPPMFSVAQVAAVVKAGRDDADFRTRISAKPPAAEMPAGRGGRAAALSTALARELGMRRPDVALSFIDPPRLDGPPRSPRDESRTVGRDALMVGDFTLGLRRPDGAWTVIQPVRSGINAWRLGLLFWLLAATATVTPFAWLLARWVTRPIATFADAAERIGRNPYSEPLAAHGPREVANAAQAMNEMQQRLTRFVDDRTVMIGAIAHDLRTPLMRIALRLEKVPDDLRHGVDRDIADMQAMIAAATDYVRGETKIGARRRLDLRSLAESAVDDLADRGENVSITTGDPVVIEGDPVALRNVVDNLLTNALRYAGDAQVTIDRDATSAIIDVRDHGPGLPANDLERIFEPFFRAEQSRSRETGGLGLGLASVRGTVHLHGGEAQIGNHPDGGILARITLPI